MHQSYGKRKRHPSCHGVGQGAEPQRPSSVATDEPPNLRRRPNAQSGRQPQATKSKPGWRGAGHLAAPHAMWMVVCSFGRGLDSRPENDWTSARPDLLWQGAVAHLNLSGAPKQGQRKRSSPSIIIFDELTIDP